MNSESSNVGKEVQGRAESSACNEVITEEPATFSRQLPPPYTANPTIHSPQRNGIHFNTDMTPPAPGVQVISGHVSYNNMGTSVIRHDNGMVTTMAPGFVITQYPSKSTRVTCKSCHAEVWTTCKSKPTWKTHFFALSFCLVCFIPCAIVPYCISDCNSAEHYCPECKAYIGSYMI